jgi:hypothetical protein
LGRASAYLDNPKGSDVRKELAFPGEKVEQAKQALADAKPLIPARWDVQIPEGVPVAIEAAVAALSAMITHTMCQENNVFFAEDEIELANLAGRVREGVPGVSSDAESQVQPGDC